MENTCNLSSVNKRKVNSIYTITNKRRHLFIENEND